MALGDFLTNQCMNSLQPTRSSQQYPPYIPPHRQYAHRADNSGKALGSWADEMDSQPIPSATSGYGSGSRDPGERRAFTQPWGGDSRGGDRGGSMSMGGRAPSFGMSNTSEERCI